MNIDFRGPMIACGIIGMLIGACCVWLGPSALHLLARFFTWLAGVIGG